MENIKDLDILVAATLVSDAQAGRNMQFQRDEKSVRAYMIYKHWTMKSLLFCCVWGNMLLALFEKPAVNHLALPYWASMVLEALFLSFLLFRFMHNYYFNTTSSFWKDPKNICVILIIFLTVLDMVVYICCVEFGVSVSVRWSRLLRPLYLINFPDGRQIRKAFRNIRRTLPDIFFVLVLFLCSIALFALLGMKLFEQRNLHYPDGSAYFTNYLDTYWDLYVLVTTANSPDVMMPSYEKNNWFSLFFVCYIIVNLYLFMSIVLAVVYYNYKKHLKNEVKTNVYQKRQLLGQAFDMVKEAHGAGYAVSKQQWHRLLKVILPGKSDLHIEVIRYVLDDDLSGHIKKAEFMKVADLLNVPLSEVKDRATYMEKTLPRCYLSKPSLFLQTLVRHRFFRYLFDAGIFANAICIAFSYEEAEWFFLTFFSCEIILKLYVFGLRKFFRNSWNVFDFVIVTTALVITLYEAMAGIRDETKERTLDYILVLRVLRLIRLMGSFKKFQIILSTIVNIGPSIATYGGVIFVIYYIYAIIGMEAFAGRITDYGYDNLNESTSYCGNPALKGSEFYSRHYCGNNFNDLTHAFVFLFELMVVNQWHVLTDGFVSVTNKAARLYFISFHLIIVVILLNIFTAFVLEVFLLEYTFSQTSELQIALERKIKDLGLALGQVQSVNQTPTKPDKNVLVHSEMTDIDLSSSNSSLPDENRPYDHTDTNISTAGIHFVLKKSGTKKIEVLLQQMFEGELQPTDQGPENVLDGHEFQPSAPITLDALP